MTPAQIESLERAKDGTSEANYAAIMAGFAAMGIPADQIQPRRHPGCNSLDDYRQTGTVKERSKNKMAGWRKEALDCYKASGDRMREQGAKPIREVNDKDNNTVLTFWATPNGLAITQVFRDTGDVVYLRDVAGATEACEKRF